MPELPEVETMRRGLLPTVGSRIHGVVQPKLRLRPIGMVPPLAQFRRRVVGRTIEVIGRVGKRVVIQLDSGDRLVFEPRMTGRVLVSEPPNTAYLRLVFELSGGSVPRLMFWDVRGLGLVHLFSAEQFVEEFGPQSIGPDALAVTAQELCQRLGQSRRAIKVALLDQRAVAGIGNLYASEILHDAAIHPETPCHKLRPEQWKRLHASIHEILEEAIRCQGSTLSDGNYRTPADEAGGYQQHHRVYQRAGKPCLRCANQSIVRVVQAQRSTFYCPRCQQE
jgi:formamidopyrimidine-DNA glycosylase